MKNLDSINPQSQQKAPTKISDSKQPLPKAQTVSLLSRPQRPKKSKTLKIISALLLVIILILGALAINRAASLADKIFVGRKTTFFQKIRDLIRGGGDNVKIIGEDLGQINILLLGIGGEGHDGPYLSDTMILAQIRPDIGQVALVSIPRDYLTNLPQGLGQQKINSAFAYGFIQHQDYDEAGRWARQQVGELSGLEIPYFAVVDFSGFEQAINKISGVDVQIDQTFTDYSYPNDATLGYLPPLTFTQGPEHMNGTRALEFARSRHAAGPEGSDFARSARQQKVIGAFKEKVINLNLITDAGKINSLINIFADHFRTNLLPSEIFRIYSLTKDKNINKFLSLSLDPETGLICPEILASNGAYVLTPCQNKSQEDVKNFFKNAFSIGQLTSEKSTVWLANSTGSKVAYDTAFRHLTNAGLNVYQLNYTKDNLPQTLVYQVNAKPATTEFIKNDLSATEVTLPPPGVPPDKNKVDVVVVLGLNAPQEAAPKLYIPPPARIPTTTPATGTPATSTSTKPSTATTTAGSIKFLTTPMTSSSSISSISTSTSTATSSKPTIKKK